MKERKREKDKKVRNWISILEKKKLKPLENDSMLTCLVLESSAKLIPG
jgi:hypothetical protein